MYCNLSQEFPCTSEDNLLFLMNYLDAIQSNKNSHRNGLWNMNLRSFFMRFFARRRCWVSFNATIPAIWASPFTFQAILCIDNWRAVLGCEMLYPSLRPARPWDFVNDLKITIFGNSLILSINDKCALGSSVSSIKLSSTRILVDSLLLSNIL